MGTGKVTAPTLLYLSAAFDAIDYSVLLDLIGMAYQAQHLPGSAHS